MSLLYDRPLPHNDEAETALLGCMIIDSREIDEEAINVVDFDGSFYVPENRIVFEHCRDMIADNREIDPLILADALEDAGKLEEAGGRTRLLQLQNAVPTSANAMEYAEIIRANAIRRMLIRETSALTNMCFECLSTPHELLDTFGQTLNSISKVLNVGSLQGISEIVAESLEYLEGVMSDDERHVGYSTGYNGIDDKFTLRAKEMIVVAGRPSMGKTALAVCMMESLAVKRQIPVGMFSLEMGSSQLITRMICSNSGVNVGSLRDPGLSVSRFPRMKKSAQSIAKCPIYIDDNAVSSIKDIRIGARRMVKDYGIKVLFVDYLQIVKSPHYKHMTRENQVSEISSSLKALAKELEICVVVLAQLNRAGEGMPRIEHLRESGAIEQDADVIALLHRDRDQEDSDELATQLIIGKNRNGQAGIVSGLFFKPSLTQFTEGWTCGGTEQEPERQEPTSQQPQQDEQGDFDF